MKNRSWRFRARSPMGLMCASAGMIAATSTSAQVIEPFRNGGSVERPSLNLPVDDSEDDILNPASNGADGVRRGVPVIVRPRPDYDPLGLPVGGFTFFPEAIASLSYDSNVYSQDEGVSDVSARARAVGTLKSNWSRNALSLSGYADQRNYAKYISEDAFTYGANASGRLNVGRDNRITGGLSHSRQLVDRAAIGEELSTRRPVRFDLSSANLGARHSFGPIAVALDGTISKYDFKDAQTPLGELSDQQYRDFTRYQSGIDLSYKFAAGPRAFVSANSEWRRYRVERTIVRDANIYEFLAGFRGEITPLIQGSVGLGYITANFLDPTIKSRSALAMNARLAYLMTELTTINLSARRYYQNVALVSAPATLNTEIQLGADHELLRNLIVSASVNYINSNYIASEGTAKRYGGRLGALWLINRKIRFDFTLDYRNRTSNRLLIQRNFSQLSATAALRYHL